MIATLNEAEQWCLRALAGGGTPPGVDEDAAWSAAWLVARGLAAIETLIAVIERCGDATAAAQVTVLPRVEGVQRFDAGGRSAVLLGGTLIDCAVAAAASGQAPARVVVTALADPLFLLPIAERYRRRGWFFLLRWGSAGARLDRDGPSLLGDAAAWRPTNAIEVSIACGREPFDDTALPVALRPEDLDARYAATLDQGVTVADETWNRLKALGLRALVPASEESRARGAGSSASDNE